MTEEVLEAINNLNGWTQQLIHKDVATVVTDYDRQLIHLQYGDKEYTFNPDGYNMLYVMKTLYNNCVLDAIMR